MPAVLFAGALPFDLVALRTNGVDHGKTSRINVKQPSLLMVGHAGAGHKRDATADSLAGKALPLPRNSRLWFRSV